MIQSLGRALLQPQAAATPRSRSREAHNHAVVASSDAVAAPGRRALLASLAAAAGSLLLPLSPASALTQRSLQSQVRHSIQFGFTCIDQFVRETVLRSRRLGPPLPHPSKQVPSTITFRNELDTAVKVYWVGTGRQAGHLKQCSVPCCMLTGAVRQCAVGDLPNKVKV